MSLLFNLNIFRYQVHKEILLHDGLILLELKFTREMRQRRKGKPLEHYKPSSGFSNRLHEISRQLLF